MHVGHLYRFAVQLHNLLNARENHGKALVFYSDTTPRARANAACLLCCYMVLVQLWSPHQVLQPIAQAEPPFMPFRDAGYSAADFEISIQDVVYGMWRAKERGMLDLAAFDLEEYERFERVDQGDLNMVSPDFVAFASPQQRKGELLGRPFLQVLDHFKRHDVRMVVRLNSHLYDAREFTKRGIDHVDMIFDDGTCPSMDIVRDFMGVAEGVISEGGKVAVHCKAGLGRTGCLIGAHLIYTHGFTANECIGYMRMMRPGMVVGPQQHWLYLHQNEFRNWRFTMALDGVAHRHLCGYPALVEREKVPSLHLRVRKVSGQLKQSFRTAVPAVLPGQPRKGHNGRYVSGTLQANEGNSSEGEDPVEELSMTERVTRSHFRIRQDDEEDEEEETTSEKAPLPRLWRVLRSITLPNNSSVISEVKKSRGLGENGSPLTSRSGARVRHRIVSQASVNEKIVSSGAIEKASQRRRRS